MNEGFWTSLFMPTGTSTTTVIGVSSDGQYWITNTPTYCSAANTANTTYTGASVYTAAGASGTVNTTIITYPTVEKAGVRAGEIVAYRAWYLLKGEELRLHSMAMPFFWTPGQTEHAPNVTYDGATGFYAYKDMTTVKSNYGARFVGAPELLVYGEVLLWGTVIEHECGYRAEYAKVHKIVEVVGERKTRYIDYIIPQRGIIDTLRKKYID